MSNTTIWIIAGLGALFLLSQKKEDVVVIMPTGNTPLSNSGTITQPTSPVPGGSFSQPGTTIPSTKRG